MSKIVITLDEAKSRKDYYECAEVTIEENGIKQKRIVEISSIMEAFSRAARNQQASIRLGRLPVGFYDGTIGEENDQLFASALIILPKSRHIMQYEKTRYDICAPSLVFYFSIVKSRVQKTRIFALKDEKPNEKSQLFVYPFGNVNIGDGAVCWGMNHLKDIRSLKDLEELMALFIQSECNEDHYRMGESCSLINTPLRGVFEMLKEKDYFPEELLVGRSSQYIYRTLGELMELLK